MVSNPKRKRGGQAKYVIGRDGKPVVGLSCSRGRYYSTHSTPRQWWGDDFDVALIKFREWEATQRGERVQFNDKGPPSKVVKDDWKHWAEHHPDPKAREYYREALASNETVKLVTLREDVFYSKLREVLSDPAQCKIATEMTGYPLDRLHKFASPKASPTLKSIGETYQDKAQITEHERRKSKLYWNTFRNAVKVKTVHELNQSHIADYYDSVINADQSQTYIKHRFGKIKTVFNFAIKRGEAPEDINTVLAYCRILNPPKANAANPHPISVEDVHSLLAVADDKWKAILLLALNCCMYGKEVADLEKTEVDLTKKVLITDRNKTGVTRVAVLWDSTIESIRNLPKHGRSHLVLSQNGAPFHPDHIRRGFVRLRKLAGLGTDVKISDIRDGAYTAAVQGDGVEFEKARILAGHRTGMSDHYIKRNPKMVVDACKAIGREYFPPPPETETEETGGAMENSGEK